MADIDIPQAEAEALINMEKRFLDEEDWTFPSAGERIALQLTSIDKRENFTLDVTRGQIKLTKATFQNRARQGDHSSAARPGRSAASQPGRLRDSMPARAHLSGRIRR
jgi:hypothetical protein